MKLLPLSHANPALIENGIERRPPLLFRRPLVILGLAASAIVLPNCSETQTPTHFSNYEQAKTEVDRLIASYKHDAPDKEDVVEMRKTMGGLAETAAKDLFSTLKEPLSRAPEDGSILLIKLAEPVSLTSDSPQTSSVALQREVDKLSGNIKYSMRLISDADTQTNLERGVNPATATSVMDFYGPGLIVASQVPNYNGSNSMNTDINVYYEWQDPKNGHMARDLSINSISPVIDDNYGSDFDLDYFSQKLGHASFSDPYDQASFSDPYDKYKWSGFHYISPKLNLDGPKSPVHQSDLEKPSNLAEASMGIIAGVENARVFVSKISEQLAA